MSTVEAAPMSGHCAERWEAVAQAFRDNLDRGGEVGASICVRHRGEVVVDIAGGWFDDAKSRPFDQDDLVLLFSTTKGMTAIAAHNLIDRGLMDLNAPVSTYWPEFAQNGKEKATVAMMLNHSVGVPGFREPLKMHAHCDWDYMVDRIGREAPFWEPGVRNGYHALNFGWTVGELVKRVSGRSLGQFYRETISGPLDADFWIGLPEEEEHRVAKLVPTVPQPGDAVIEVYTNVVEHPASPSALTFINSGGFDPAGVNPDTGELIVNERQVHAAEIGGAGGIGSARGIARVYGALGEESIISRDHVTKMGLTSMVSTKDPIILIPSRFALGFMKSMDNRHMPLGNVISWVIGARAFGHVGAGGSFGLYDPDEDVSVGYAMRRLGPNVLVDDRGQALTDAVYKSLGYRTSKPGVWVR